MTMMIVKGTLEFLDNESGRWPFAFPIPLPVFDIIDNVYRENCEWGSKNSLTFSECPNVL